MEISAISANIGVQARVSSPDIGRRAARIIENRDEDGDQRLNLAELGNQPGLLKRVDSNGDSFVNQEELFAALSKRLEGQNSTSIEISLDINVIKANLGNLLSSLQSQSDSDNLSNLFNASSIPGEVSRSDVNVRERYISAISVGGLDSGNLFSSTGTLSSNTTSNSINPFTSTQNDGRQLLLDLLVDQLGTPRDDAVTILNVLQNQSFQAVA